MTEAYSTIVRTQCMLAILNVANNDRGSIEES